MVTGRLRGKDNGGWETEDAGGGGTEGAGGTTCSPLTTLFCSPGGAGHLSGSHFTHYHQPTTDRLKVLQGETGERESAVCGVECA